MIKKFLPLFLIIALFAMCNNPSDNKSMTADHSNSTDSCCLKKGVDSTKLASNTSEITCPKCGHKKMETLPTDVCVIKYTCENCKAVLTPKAGDCCVYCTYGTHKCPSKQDE